MLQLHRNNSLINEYVLPRSELPQQQLDALALFTFTALDQLVSPPDNVSARLLGFFGMNGMQLAKNGTFNDRRTAQPMTYTDYHDAAMCADRTYLVQPTPLESALSNDTESSLPAIVVLKGWDMNRTGNNQVKWGAPGSHNPKYRSSPFDRVVASVVYIPQTQSAFEKIFTKKTPHRVYKNIDVAKKVKQMHDAEQIFGAAHLADQATFLQLVKFVSGRRIEIC